jgi:MFS family permease
MTLKNLWRDPLNRNYLYAFLKDFAFFSAVLVPFFTEWGHISLFQVQLIQSWFSFWVFVLEVPTGAVADKIGRKHSLTIGAIMVAIAVVVYGSIPNFWIFLLAEFLFAFGYALTSGADDALLYDTLKELGREDESKVVMGRADSFHLMGMMIAAPIGGIIAAKFGLNAPTIVSGVPYLLAAAVAWSIPEPKVHSEGSESPRYLEIVKKGFSTIRRHPVIRTLAIDSVLVASAAYFVVWLYQPLLSQVSIPIVFFGLAQAFLLGTEMLVSGNFVWLEKILGSGRSYIRATAIMVTLSFLIAAIFPNVWTILLLLAVGGGIGYTRATYISSIANKHITSRERATVLSSISMVRRLAIVILNPIIGFLATRSLSLALIVVSLLPIGTLFIKEDID